VVYLRPSNVFGLFHLLILVVPWKKRLSGALTGGERHVSNCIPAGRATEGLMGSAILSFAPTSAICCTVIRALAALAIEAAAHSSSSTFEGVDCFFFRDDGADAFDSDCFFFADDGIAAVEGEDCLFFADDDTATTSGLVVPFFI
jgi:hypothetical protein